MPTGSSSRQLGAWCNYPKKTNKKCFESSTLESNHKSLADTGTVKSTFAVAERPFSSVGGGNGSEH